MHNVMHAWHERPRLSLAIVWPTTLASYRLESGKVTCMQGCTVHGLYNIYKYITFNYRPLIVSWGTMFIQHHMHAG